MNSPEIRSFFDAVIVTVAAWEIECCAPPPIVGESTSWTLEFSPVSEPDLYWLPPALTNLEWQVEMWPSADGPHRMLSHGGIVALLPAEDHLGHIQLPEPGYHRMLGSISGSKHGGRGELDDFPTTTAQVAFLDIITAAHTLNEDRILVPVDGGYRLFPTRRSPRWFGRGFRGDNGQPAGDDFGLLMRLT